jgi:opacity protein-like surface antigen
MKKVVAALALAAALVAPASVAHASDAARAGVTKCPGGFYVWYYDLSNNYHVVFSTCIYP